MGNIGYVTANGYKFKDDDKESYRQAILSMMDGNGFLGTGFRSYCSTIKLEGKRRTVASAGKRLFSHKTLSVQNVHG